MTTQAKDSWTVETDRMRVTLVSEPMPMPPMPKGMPSNMAWTQEQMPSIPRYVLITRPGREEPIRVEGEDVLLLMYVLSKLPTAPRRHYAPMHQMVGTPMHPGDGGDWIG